MVPFGICLRQNVVLLDQFGHFSVQLGDTEVLLLL
jgi:hypothetical protein